MKLLSSSGREYSIQPLDYIRSNDDTKNKSSGHLLARNILKELYPGEWILEEVPLKINKSTLYADFLIKRHNLVIEVQGKQHKEFNAFFHKTIENFRESKKRDIQKQNWCEINGFTLIELYDGETEDEWRKRLR